MLSTAARPSTKSGRLVRMHANGRERHKWPAAASNELTHHVALMANWVCAPRSRSTSPRVRLAFALRSTRRSGTVPPWVPTRSCVTKPRRSSRLSWPSRRLHHSSSSAAVSRAWPESSSCPTRAVTLKPSSPKRCPSKRPPRLLPSNRRTWPRFRRTKLPRPLSTALPLLVYVLSPSTSMPTVPAKSTRIASSRPPGAECLARVESVSKRPPSRDLRRSRKPPCPHARNGRYRSLVRPAPWPRPHGAERGIVAPEPDLPMAQNASLI